MLVLLPDLSGPYYFENISFHFAQTIPKNCTNYFAPTYWNNLSEVISLCMATVLILFFHYFHYFHYMHYFTGIEVILWIIICVVLVNCIIFHVQALLATLKLQDSAKSKGHFPLYKCFVLGAHQIQWSATSVLQALSFENVLLQPQA
jgi:hypothetical protein